MRVLRFVAWATVASGVALLSAVGRRPDRYSRYKGRHWVRSRNPVPLLRASLGRRVRSVGIELPAEPAPAEPMSSVLLPEEPTVSLSTSGVRALGQLVARQAAKNTATVINE